MMKQITPPVTGPAASKTPLSELLPEMGKWCVELTDADRSGVAWRPFLRDYCERIGPGRTLALVREVYYVQLVGQGLRAGPEILLSRLGLDEVILIEEACTAQQFVTDLFSELLLPPAA
jgi:hypothetical protein